MRAVENQDSRLQCEHCKRLARGAHDLPSSAVVVHRAFRKIALWDTGEPSRNVNNGMIRAWVAAFWNDLSWSGGERRSAVELEAGTSVG
jgi:hypothetical protein